MAHAESGRVLALLSKLDSENLTVPAALATGDRGVVELVGRIRAATEQVLQDLEPRRTDVWRRQMALARIAAGLNWAAKPLDDLRLRQAAFLWAAWATRLLLRGDGELAPHWEELAKHDPGAPQTAEAIATPVTTATALERWTPFQARSPGGIGSRRPQGSVASRQQEGRPIQAAKQPRYSTGAAATRPWATRDLGHGWSAPLGILLGVILLTGGNPCSGKAGG
jgi:hypothetical protein